MDKNSALELLQNQFRSILNDDSIVLTLETTEEDVDKWDSLFQAQLVTNLENMLGIKFALREILSWESIDEIAESIVDHTA